MYSAGVQRNVHSWTSVRTVLPGQSITKKERRKKRRWAGGQVVTCTQIQVDKLTVVLIDLNRLVYSTGGQKECT